MQDKLAIAFRKKLGLQEPKQPSRQAAHVEVYKAKHVMPDLKNQKQEPTRSMKEIFQKAIKKKIFEAQVEKFAKGYERLAQFDTSMSMPVLNFGLKLYNI